MAWVSLCRVEGLLMQERTQINNSDTEQHIAFFTTPGSTLHKVRLFRITSCTKVTYDIVFG